MMSQRSTLAGSSTKEKIIELLSEQWPLRAKKIYRSLLKNYHLSITYQATHKALKELIENKILEKRKEGYLINRDWIKKLGEFSEKIDRGFEETDKKREAKLIQRISFDTHSDFIRFHVGFIEETIRKERKLNMIFYFRHVPSPNSLTIDEVKRLKPFFSKIKWKIISKSANPFDKWCANYWRKFGVKVEIGKDIPTNSRLIVMNDYVIHVYTPKEAQRLWDKTFSVRNVNEANVHTITEGLLSKKYKTIITILKDKEIASLLR